MNEVWRDVVGYEGLYQVSNLGRVRSIDRVTFSTGTMREDANYHFKGKLLKQGNKNASISPYKQVVLYKDRKHKTYGVHRLVAEAFIPNPNNLPQVNHKDENPSNNNVNNLEWCTAKYNVNYGTATKRRANKIRNNAYNQKAVICIDTGIEYCNSFDAERKTGINSNRIKECCKGNYNTAGGCKWKWGNEYHNPSICLDKIDEGVLLEIIGCEISSYTTAYTTDRVVISAKNVSRNLNAPIYQVRKSIRKLVNIGYIERCSVGRPAIESNTENGYELICEALPPLNGFSLTELGFESEYYKREYDRFNESMKEWANGI